MTKKLVSAWAKKNFIHWFIENYQISADGPRQVLLDIAESEEILFRLHIVYNGSYLRPLLVISTDDTGMPPVLMKTLDNTVTEISEIADQILRPDNDPIYLTLYFPDRSSCEPYQAVLEENPSNSDNAHANQILIDFELSLWAAGFKRDMEKNELLKLIDQALDEKNKRRFRQLVKKLKKL